MDIKTRILIPAIALTLLVVAAVLVSNIILFSDHVKVSTTERVETALEIAIHHLGDLKARAASASLSIAENQEISEAIASGDRGKLLARALEIQNKAGVEFCTITDPRGTVLVRTHNPELWGDSLAYQISIKAAMSGKSMTAIEEGNAVLLSVRSAMPVVDGKGVVTGVVSAGFRLDRESFVDTVKEISGCESTVLSGSLRIATTVLNEDGTRVVGTEAPAQIAAMFLAGIPYSGEADIQGRPSITSYAPIEGPDGKVTGALYAGQYLDVIAENVWAFVRSGLIITLIMLTIFIAVILFTVSRIVAPVDAMTRAAVALAAGDTDIDIRVNTTGEMRTLAEAFSRMIENTRLQVKIVEHIAAGDLTAPVEARSEKDVMNRALQNLNTTIRAQAAAIREEHERVQLMLDATPLACRLWSRDFNLLEGNEAAVRLFGLKNKKEYIERYFELSPEYQSDGQKTRDKVREIISEAFEKGECTHEWQYQMPDGTPIPCEVTLVRVPYGDDFVVAAYSRDLREQKKMMADIEHRDNLLDTSRRVSFILFDTAEDRDIEAVLVESMELLGQCVNADQAYITQNETVDGVPYFACKSAWVRDSNKVKSAIGPGMRFPWGLDLDWDSRFRRSECMNGPVKDLPLAVQGFFTPFEALSVLVIPVFVQENFWGLVGFSDCEEERFFGQDEVEILRSMSLMMATAVHRKEQAARIREAHERTRLLTNATPLGFNLWDKDIRNIATNDTAVNLFGFSDQEEYLRRFFELSPPRQADGSPSKEKAIEHIRAAFRDGYRRVEWMHQKPDGTRIPMEITLVRLRYGDDYAVAGYMRDLREYKKMIAEIQDTSARLEAALTDAEEANSAKSRFLAHMSHEMRTPLNAVIGLSELTLGEEGLSPEAESNLEKISGAGSTILSIVNDILDISKIESGKFELYPVQYDTPSLINDTVTLNIVRIGEKPIVFKLYIDENFPAVLYGDDLRVKQIFNNLLSNAFKYTNSGSVEWRISYETAGEDVWLISSVKDTGIGIKPEDVERLFSDYNQVDTKANRKVQGTGLGLSITKRMVEMMEGSIGVESEYGKGTTFQIRIKQEKVNNGVIGKEVARNLMSLRYILSQRTRNTHITRVKMPYAKILVVDDIETNLDVVKGMIKPYGIQVDCAMSGHQAIEMIRSENPRYNAVFMDHMMPEMDGIETTEIIRKELGSDYARNVPVIALTANAIVGNEEMFLRHGFQDFISKPIDIMKLDAVLRRWVRDKDQEKEPFETREEEIFVDTGESGAENNVSLLKDITINGLDIEKALERFDGSETIFLDVLRSYVVNTPRLLDNLDAYLSEGNLTDYAIVIHGIKGSNYGILAWEAGQAAEALERAARDGQIDAVKAGHKDFRKLSETLLEEMKEALGKLDSGRSRLTASAPDPSLLEELRAACKAFDMGRVDRAMEKLESFRYRSGEELVSWLREQVNNMTFEEISDGEWPV